MKFFKRNNSAAAVNSEANLQKSNGDDFMLRTRQDSVVNSSRKHCGSPSKVADGTRKPLIKTATAAPNDTNQMASLSEQEIMDLMDQVATPGVVPD
jgi:hypothetical protein